jgi:hypothetical protein
MSYVPYLSAKQARREIHFSRSLDRKPRRHLNMAPFAQCPHRRASNGSFLLAVCATNVNAFTSPRNEHLFSEMRMGHTAQ